MQAVPVPQNGNHRAVLESTLGIPPFMPAAWHSSLTLRLVDCCHNIMSSSTTHFQLSPTWTRASSEGQNFDLEKYIGSSTRYEYSIQYILYHMIQYIVFSKNFNVSFETVSICHYKAVYSIKQFTAVLKRPIIFFLL